jgi:glycerol-3-phosphate responsive antiterminator|tara:strand:+ start:75 stop:278 length:204 start_codon:yes stop_codon:yes gene_type:complete
MRVLMSLVMLFAVTTQLFANTDVKELSKDQFIEIQLKDGVTAEEATAMFVELDTNKDGKLSVEEQSN